LQSLSEPTSMASSPYRILKHLRISIGLEPSAIRNQSPLSAEYVCPQHPPFCTATVLKARDWLEHGWSWLCWTVSLSEGYGNKLYQAPYLR
jgi:hypothetical protein